MPLQGIDKLNKIICTGRPAPNVLTVTMNQTVFFSPQLCATIVDRVPALDILALPPPPPSMPRTAVLRRRAVT